MGESLQLTGHFQKAKSSYLKARRIYSRLSDPAGLVITDQKLGDIFRQTENFTEAEKWYRQALREAGKIKNRKSTFPFSTDAICGLALAQRGKGKYLEAIQLLEKCRRAFLSSFDEQGLAYVFWALGTTCRFAGRLKEAENHLRKSLQIYARLKDEGGQAYAGCGLGGTLRIQGKPRESFWLYQRATQTFKKIEDKFGIAYSLCGEGNSLRMQNRHLESIPYFKKAIGIYQSLGQKGPRAFVLWNLSQSLNSVGRRREAFALLKKAQKLFIEVKDNRGIVYVFLGFGEILRNLNTSVSQANYVKAAKIAKRSKLPLEYLYAQRRIIDEPLTSEFKNCGVYWPGFQNYQSIP